MNKAAIVYKTLIFISSCCFFIAAFTLQTQAQTRGRVEIVKDSRIDTLIARRYSPKKSGGAGGNSYSSFGYRVQFFSGSSRSEAFHAQTRFQELYPEIRTYIVYKEPNFKIKAGDFRTRLEAAKLMQQLRSQFSTLFILPEKITPPLEPVNTND